MLKVVGTNVVSRPVCICNGHEFKLDKNAALREVCIMQVCILQLSTSNAMHEVCIMQVCIMQLSTFKEKKKSLSPVRNGMNWEKFILFTPADNG